MPDPNSNIGSLSNLVAKDAINRYKVMRGNRVHFVNGFNAYDLERKETPGLSIVDQREQWTM
jgi:methionyl-tRNA synthetase